MGPAGIWTALYPPRPSSGPRVRFLIIHHITFMSIFSYFYIITVTHLTYCNNKVIIFTLVFLFWLVNHLFGYCTLVWIVDIDYDTYRYILWYSDGTCSVQGCCTPHPGHAPPARKAVLPGVLCEHMCSCLSYVTVHYWVWECGCIEA